MSIARLSASATRYPRELGLRPTLRIPPESRAQFATRKPLIRVAFVATATMGACSQIVALITKNAVQSTAFLLRIAEDSKGKALSEADASLRSSQSRQEIKIGC